jgi:hypothetical protein
VRLRSRVASDSGITCLVLGVWIAAGQVPEKDDGTTVTSGVIVGKAYGAAGIPEILLVSPPAIITASTIRMTARQTPVMTIKTGMDIFLSTVIGCFH